jgi:hypothetical protein
LNFHFWKGETLGVDETEFNTQQWPSVFGTADNHQVRRS